jgi:hypothetical protein
MRRMFRPMIALSSLSAFSASAFSASASGTQGQAVRPGTGAPLVPAPSGRPAVPVAQRGQPLPAPQSQQGGSASLVTRPASGAPHPGQVLPRGSLLDLSV